MKIPLLLCLAALVAQADDIPDMPPEHLADPAATIAAAAKATPGRFPDADTVMVDDRIHTAYAPDGSDCTWDDEWVKVLTEKGRRSCATLSISFNARYGDAAIFCVEIVGTNGQVRAVDFARLQKTATDNSGMSANIVDPLDRRMTCAVPGLAVGEIRHVRYARRTRKSRMKGTWADHNVLEHTSPILSTVVTVDQPDANPVRHAILRHPCGDTVVRAANAPLGNGRTLLRWTARDVPQAFAEPNMPPLSRCVQGLWLSTAADWPTVSRWYWKLCEPHLAATTPAMTNLVRDLAKGCATRDAKVRALFKFVSQEVRYMGLTLEDDAPGYEPHDVNVTFDNRYGVCRDKAALLVALLRIAGIPAYPVLIHAGAKMDTDVPIPYFNHAIVAVESEEPASSNLELMDPTDESSRDLMPSYLSDRSYLAATPRGDALRTSPVKPVAENMLRVDSTGTLSPDGAILLTSRFSFDGINDTALRHMLLKRTPDERRRAFESFIRSVAPGTELLSLDLRPADLRDTESRLEATTVARLPEAVLRGRTRDSLSLPFITQGLSVANALLDENTSLETRRFPLVLSTTAGTAEALSLTLGEEALGDVASMPAPCLVTNAPGYLFARTATMTNGTLNAVRTEEVRDINFEAHAYDALRNARKEVEATERAQPVFAARTDGNAHVKIRKSRTVVHFTSPTSWTSTNAVEKEILTYRGKKSSAEMKYTYSPCTRKVEIVSATVSNANGKVFAVTPKEINEMDCGWAAGAPRYPSSKILVANLPGVEIGSVIRTTVARTVTNSPTAYTSIITFGGTEPCDFESYEFHVPPSMSTAFKFFEDLKDINDAKGLKDLKDIKVVKDLEAGAYRWEWTRPPRVPDEPSQPPLSRWRPSVTVSAADWKKQGGAILDALALARAAGSAAARRKGHELADAQERATPAARITAIRAFLAHNLRVTGPGLFELPFDRAFSPPDRALADGYASNADRMNLLFSMLEGAGFRCSFVFAADTVRSFTLTEAERRRTPRPSSFDSLVIRATDASGRIFWVADENEHTPPETTSREGDDIYDPASDKFGIVDVPLDSPWRGHADSRCLITVRENGSADFDITNLTYGAGVGSFRKRFEEMLPELRSRFFQQLVGNLSKNATATSALATDTRGYPASLSFSAHVADFAVIQGDALTLTIPDFSSSLFSVGGPLRKSPLAVPGKAEEVDTYEIILPEGYTAVEHLPESLLLANPMRPDEAWLTHDVSQRVVDGRLRVTVRRRARREHATLLTADYFPFLRDWNRRASSRACRTLTVRKAPRR
ncbi:MAG: DUF3857 domain-containing protein [Kiritimatiellae bacterium]|nr:DUF3857 domain-containing protein [Kiritimatiellia bacterium]